MAVDFDEAVAATTEGPVQYQDSGGDGPVVLFVHGTPGGCDQGALMGEFLADVGFRVVAPSRPGYPGTPLSDAGATPPAQGALHAALMDQLGIDRFSAVCWSGGGPSTYQLAIDHPDRVVSVVGIAAVSMPYSFEHPAEEKMLFRRPGAWLMKLAAERAPKTVVGTMVTEEGDLPKEEAKRLAAEVWADEASREWVLRWIDTVIGDRAAGFDNDRAHFEGLSLDLRSVTAPVLLVHAETDADVPIAHSEHALEELPDARLERISSGTHISVWTGPHELGTQQRISDFLQG